MSTLKEKIESILGKHSLTLLFTGFFFVIFVGSLLYLCWALGDSSQARSFNLLIIVVGALVGWAVGMFFSPFGKTQANNFQFIGKTVGAFFSGYVLSKLEKILNPLIAHAERDPLNLVQWDRVGIFVGSFLLAAIVVFINRTHAPGIPQNSSP